MDDYAFARGSIQGWSTTVLEEQPKATEMKESSRNLLDAVHAYHEATEKIPSFETQVTKTMITTYPDVGKETGEKSVATYKKYLGEEGTEFPPGTQLGFDKQGRVTLVRKPEKEEGVFKEVIPKLMITGPVERPQITERGEEKPGDVKLIVGESDKPEETAAIEPESRIAQASILNEFVEQTQSMSEDFPEVSVEKAALKRGIDEAMEELQVLPEGKYLEPGFVTKKIYKEINNEYEKRGGPNFAYNNLERFTREQSFTQKHADRLEVLDEKLKKRRKLSSKEMEEKKLLDNREFFSQYIPVLQKAEEIDNQIIAEEQRRKFEEKRGKFQQYDVDQFAVPPSSTGKATTTSTNTSPTTDDIEEAAASTSPTSGTTKPPDQETLDNDAPGKSMKQSEYFQGAPGTNINVKGFAKYPTGQDVVIKETVISRKPTTAAIEDLMMRRSYRSFMGQPSSKVSSILSPSTFTKKGKPRKSRRGAKS